MSAPENWAVILAGGDGARLQAFTRIFSGDDRPKQFCRLLGQQTLISATRERLSLIVKPDRTLCVVTRHHEPFYREELGDLGAWRLVEQPCNRGTTLGIAYGLARVGTLAPGSVVGFFPADHHYDCDAALRRAVATAYRAARADPDARIFLVGATPDRPETDYGWIVPGATLDVSARVTTLGRSVWAVNGFFEKPSESEALALMERRCLWNTFVLVGQAEAFESVLQTRKPGLFETVKAIDALTDRSAATAAMAGLYASIQSSDFSREVLSAAPDRLGVIDLPAAGWTDLGQQSRVQEVMATRGWVVPRQTLAAS